ncbi:MAG: sulfate transporter CysZ [Gammaproteobacteria bacterium]
MTSSPRKPGGLRRGAGYVLRGLRLIREPSVRGYVIIPLLINIVLFSAGIASIAWGLDLVMDRFLPDWLDWLRFLLWPLFLIASLVIVFYGFTILANLVASPFNGMLAAAVERHLTGNTEQIPLSFSMLWREILRTVGAALRKLGYFVLWALPCLLLFIIPGVNVIAAPVWFALGAWMLAIEYVDCPLGNHGQPFPVVKTKLRPQRRLALGFGGTVMALTMIPIVNFIAMPVGVAAATALYLDELSGE